MIVSGKELFMVVVFSYCVGFKGDDVVIWFKSRELVSDDDYCLFCCDFGYIGLDYCFVFCIQS